MHVAECVGTLMQALLLQVGQDIVGKYFPPGPHGAHVTGDCFLLCVTFEPCHMDLWACRSVQSRLWQLMGQSLQVELCAKLEDRQSRCEIWTSVLSLSTQAVRHTTVWAV